MLIAQRSPGPSGQFQALGETKALVGAAAAEPGPASGPEADRAAAPRADVEAAPAPGPNANHAVATPTYVTFGDGDVYIDYASVFSEWDTRSCDPDYTLLANLISDTTALHAVAGSTPVVFCPTQVPNVDVSTEACPLRSVLYAAPVTWGTPVEAQGLQKDNGAPNPGWYGYPAGGGLPQANGTKLKNGLDAVYQPGANAGDPPAFNAWDTAHGGRNDPSTGRLARKVLVLFTDGKDEVLNGSGFDALAWDEEFIAAAAAIKLGPDGLENTDDDVEIYTVGFFCDPSSNPGNPAWCASNLALTASPHPCPDGDWNLIQGSASATDQLLQAASSSATGTCDHYFPIKKTESLPKLFQALAGRISRGKLTE